MSFVIFVVFSSFLCALASLRETRNASSMRYTLLRREAGVSIEGEETEMIVGVPKEIKNNEFRVALVPSGAEALVEAGHTVLVETGAGLGTSIEDWEYEEAGAT